MRKSTGILVALIAVSALAIPSRPTASRPSIEHHQGHAVVAGEALVAFKHAPGLVRVRVEDASDEIAPVGRGAVWRVHSSVRGVDALLASYASRGDVEFAEPNYILYAGAEPNDPRFPELWGLQNVGQVIAGVAGTPGADIGASRAWDLTRGSRTTVVGVVDTGIDYSHPDLSANVWSAPSRFSVALSGVTITCAAGTHGYNAVANTCDPFDDNGHGTHVSGTIGAVADNDVGVAGVNGLANIMALKFLTANGSGTLSNALDAIEFAIQAKAALGAAANVRVLSNSWAGGAFSQALLNEINRANQSEMLFVAAAGNSGADNDATPTYPASYAAPNVVAVAATDNRDALASFSNYGATSVHLGAPGVQVLSTFPGGDYKFFSGTSMATPHVSGASALVLSRCSTMPTDALKAVLVNTIDPIPPLAGRTITGGRLNVARAVESCGRIGNRAPAVTLTSPSGDSTYDTSSRIAVTAAAADGDGTIAQVAFFAGTALMGVVTAPPYETALVNPPVGTYALTAVATDNDGATATSTAATIRVLPGPASQPFHGTATILPGLIEAENFNDGGEGLGYHDATAGNTGGAYRQTDVDIQPTSDVGGGFAVAFGQPGEWLVYSVSASATTSYTLDARVASSGTGGTFHVEVDGVDATGRLSVPNTGGWQTWQTMSASGIPLTAGPHVMRLVIDSAGPSGWFGNLNYLRWTAPGINGPPSVQMTSPANGSTYTAPATIALSATASDGDGAVTRVAFYNGSTLIATDTSVPYGMSWTNVPPGTYSLTAVATDDAGASTTSAALSIQVFAPPKSTPFGGVAAAIPGSIEAENFDEGGEGVAYHDATRGNSGGKYRQTDVDIETTTDIGGGYSLGYVVAGEWLKYTVSVAATGTYTIEARVAALGAGGVFHVEVDDVDVTQPLAVPDTGGWQAWRSVAFGGIRLTAGPHVVRVVIDKNGAGGYFGNINALRWTAASAGNLPPAIQLTSPADGATFNRKAAAAVTAAVDDRDGTVSQVAFYAGASLIGIDTSAPFTVSWTPVDSADYVLAARAIDNEGASTWSAPITVHVVAPTAPAPFGGVPAAVPGTIEAENFDEGGEGLAYHDTTAGNSGGQYRQTDVDVEGSADAGGGYSLGYVTAGEWLVYSVTVSTSGSYTLQARVASASLGGTFHVEVDGVNVTGALAVPNTGGWHAWQTITKTGVALTAGPHLLRIVVDGVGASGYLGNVNYLRWVAE